MKFIGYDCFQNFFGGLLLKIECKKRIFDVSYSGVEVIEL